MIHIILFTFFDSSDMCLPFNILFEVKRSGNFGDEKKKKNQRTKEKILLKNFKSIYYYYYAKIKQSFTE